MLASGAVTRKAPDPLAAKKGLRIAGF